MFATLLGALPRPTADGEGMPLAPVAGGPEVDALNDLIGVAARAQEAAGIEPLTDGRLRDPTFDRLARQLARTDNFEDAVAAVLEGWRTLAAVTERATKQALPGPYTIGLRMSGGAGDREGTTLAAAEALAEIVEALAAAGCPLVEIEELEPQRLEDERERQLFREAHSRLAAGSATVHQTLSFVGGSVPQAAIDSVLEAPYASVAVDLIAGPDNWYLVRRMPRDRGVIAGVLSGAPTDEAKEVMHWAAHYAAASTGRGRDRVGVGSAGSWASLTWEVALRKMHRLGEAARLAAMPRGDELTRSLDPRAVSSRRAALGHDEPSHPRPRRKGAP
jgi:methionine synthase II (cobalamin-independent)